MRIRNTKPEFWRSKTIAALSWDARLVLKAVEAYVDDNGVGKDDLVLFASDAFPRDVYQKPEETYLRLQEALTELEDGGLVVRYSADGESLMYVDRWKEKVYLNKPAKGRFRRPDGTLEYSESVDPTSYQKPAEDYLPRKEDSLPQSVSQLVRESVSQENLPASPRGGLVPFETSTPTSQTLIKEWIDHCASPPPGRVKGQIAKELKTMLDEGIPYHQVRQGLAEWNTRDVHPSVLPSIVHGVANRQRINGRQKETDDLFDRAMQRAIARDEAAGQ
jgi:hypothetical protein